MRTTRLHLGSAVTLAATLALLLLLLSSSAIAQTPAEICKAREQACAEDCWRIRDDAATANCAKSHYSGCALDVIGCFSGDCMFAFTTDFCAAAGYLECVEGPTAANHACLTSCNDQFRNAASADVARQVMANCWNDCYAPFDEAIVACKAAACDPKCVAEGHAAGIWTPRNPPAWERCTCVDETPAAPAEQSAEQPAAPSGGVAQGGLLGAGSVPALPPPSGSCTQRVRQVRMRLVDSWSVGEIGGYTRVFYDIQELDDDGIVLRSTRIRFSGIGLTAGWVANYGFAPGTDWTYLTARRPICLEDLHNAKGYHSSAGAVLGSWGAFYVGTRDSRADKVLQSSGVGWQVGPFIGVDWMWGSWQIVQPIIVH